MLEVDAAEFSGALHQRHKQIGIVVGDDSFKDRGGAFKAHAGVNAGLGQGRQFAALIAVVLHEDEVPDFDEAAAVAREFAFRCGKAVAEIRRGGAHVVMNFAAWATRAGIAHGPEILFQPGNGHDALGGNVLLEPELLGLFIEMIVNAARNNNARCHVIRCKVALFSTSVTVDVPLEYRQAIGHVAWQTCYLEANVTWL